MFYCSEVHRNCCQPGPSFPLWCWECLGDNDGEDLKSLTGSEKSHQPRRKSRRTTVCSTDGHEKCDLCNERAMDGDSTNVMKENGQFENCDNRMEVEMNQGDGFESTDGNVIEDEMEQLGPIALREEENIDVKFSDLTQTVNVVDVNGSIRSRNVKKSKDRPSDDITLLENGSSNIWNRLFKSR